MVAAVDQGRDQEARNGAMGHPPTHMLKLRNVEVPLANFFASGLLRLGPKLGPILWQFPPRMKFDPERFRTFLEMLPKTTIEAANLAGRHDARLNGPSWLTCDVERPLRHALEIRDETFRDPRFIALLREWGRAGLCRYGRVASADGCDSRFHLLPAAWFGAALCQRL